MIQFHDAHCHLTQFKNIKQIINDSLNNKVTKIIAVSMFREENHKVLKLYQNFSDIISPAFGIHPIVITKDDDIDILFEETCQIIKENINITKIVGEIGLDKYFSRDPKVWDMQKELFKKFLTFSEKHNLGISVHGKYAERDVLDILESFKIRPTIIHWFSTNDELIKRGIDNDYYYSVNFSAKYSKNVQNLIKMTPLNRLLTESDGPVKYKPINLIGSPILIPEVIKEISRIKNLEFKEVATIIQRNFEMII
ncbi:MAG: TatD family hydrolase [Candidatus Helarchaeota archaeon]